ncbi:MAG: GNAT family N-acetyltransferase [Proteobacteria bacterium]|nr:GNAT family N-acetyltransferase [Pseudomonadota bacterium]
MRVLETDRLTLRWLEPGDAPFILELLNQPSFLHFIGDRGVGTIEEARKYIRQGPGRSYAEQGFGLYMVELKDDLKPIGMCGLLRRETLEDVDLGFAFLPQFWGQGYAYESTKAVLAHGKADFDLKRIVAVTASDNQAAIRLLEKLGLRFERTIRLADDQPEVKLFA